MGGKVGRVLIALAFISLLVGLGLLAIELRGARADLADHRHRLEQIERTLGEHATKLAEVGPRAEEAVKEANAAKLGAWAAQQSAMGTARELSAGLERVEALARDARDNADSALHYVCRRVGC